MKIIKLFLLSLLISNTTSVLRCMNGYQPLNEASSKNQTLDISGEDLNQANFEKNLYQTIKNNGIVTLKLSLAQFLNFPKNSMQLFLKKKTSLRTFRISLPENVKEENVDFQQIIKKIGKTPDDNSISPISPIYISIKNLADFEANSEILKINVGEVTIYIFQEEKELKWKLADKICKGFMLGTSAVMIIFATYQAFFAPTQNSACCYH
jgi:hypothetical protein